MPKLLESLLLELKPLQLQAIGNIKERSKISSFLFGNEWNELTKRDLKFRKLDWSAKGKIFGVLGIISEI